MHTFVGCGFNKFAITRKHVVTVGGKSRFANISTTRPRASDILL